MINEHTLEQLKAISEQQQTSGNEKTESAILLSADACSGHFSDQPRSEIETVYVCAGMITCLSSETTLQVRAGELLFLNPDFPCQICGTGHRDIAVSFLISPDFAGHMLTFIGGGQSPLGLFLMDCLFRQNQGPGYLYFQASGIVQIQNLAENLLLTLLLPSPGSARISEMTFSLLCLELLEHTETIYHDKQAELIPRMLDYIDGNYTEGKLMDAAGLLDYDVSILSREIRRQTGQTFTDLIQKKRMTQAAALLRTTSLTVEAVSRSVGYENVSYFHRLFRRTFGMTPRQYRTEKT